MKLGSLQKTFFSVVLSELTVSALQKKYSDSFFPGSLLHNKSFLVRFGGFITSLHN